VHDTHTDIRTTRTGVARLAAIGGVAGPILFATVVIVAGVIYDGYSHVSQKISELGGDGADHAIVQNVNFIVLGGLVLGFAWALADALGSPRTGPALIGFFGLSSAIGNGVLPCDEGCKGETTVGLLHIITGLSGFVAALAGMALLARRWRRDPAWRSHADFTQRTFVVALVGLIWFVATQAADAQSLAGIAQRIFVGSFLVWIAVTAARLLTRPEHKSEFGNA